MRLIKRGRDFRRERTGGKLGLICEERKMRSADVTHFPLRNSRSRTPREQFFKLSSLGSITYFLWCGIILSNSYSCKTPGQIFKQFNPKV